MCLHITCLRGCIVTLVAFVCLFSAVCFQMCLQSACMRGCKVTLLHLFDFSPLCVFKCVLMKAIWGDIWKITKEKVKQMQPMWLAFSHEGDLRRHLKHCQRHNGPRNWVRNSLENIYLFWYLIYHIMDNGEKSSKCNLCDYDTVSGWGQDLFRRNSYFESGQMVPPSGMSRPVQLQWRVQKQLPRWDFLDRKRYVYDNIKMVKKGLKFWPL